MNRAMLTVQEAARLLDVNRCQIHRAIAYERLPAERFGPIWLIHPAALARWTLASQKRRAAWRRTHPKKEKR